jgi:hypothetical protein
MADVDLTGVSRRRRQQGRREGCWWFVAVAPSCHGIPHIATYFADDISMGLPHDAPASSVASNHHVDGWIDHSSRRSGPDGH